MEVILVMAALLFLLIRSRLDLRALRRAHEKILLSEERYRLANYGTNDTVWDLDLVTGEVWTGEAHRERYGNPPGVRHSWSSFGERVHPEDAPRVTAKFRKTLQSNATIWSDEFRYWQYDGTYANVVDRGYVVRNSEGRAIRMIGALTDVTDVTALRRAKEAVDRLSRQNELILNSAGEGIFGIDLQGQATFINAAAASMLGWSSEELISVRLYDTIHPLHAGPSQTRDACPVRWSLATGTVQACDTEVFTRRDGSQFPVDYTSNPILDEGGSAAGAVVVFRDITERRAIEQLKSELIATVSHELRTPLTSIRGALGLLGSGLAGDVGQRGKRMLEIALENCDRLTRLTNDILDIEKLDDGKMPMERRSCDVAAIVRHVVDALRPIAEKASVLLHAEVESSFIRADPDRIMQTLTNLIGNAIKFSPRNGVIRVTTVDLGAELCFRVEDQGRGIPARLHQSIFDRFRQVDASDSRDKGGTGLGLAICKAIVQQHGGRIWVESTVGSGSTFSFTIPRSESALAAVV